MGAAAAALIVLQTVLRGAILARGYLTQDDFNMTRLGSAPMSTDLLLQEYAGHIWPGNFLSAWVHARTGPLEWWQFVAEILVLQLVAAAMAWLVLCRLIPGAPARLPLLALALFSPLTWWPTAWWAAAIGFLPLTIALFTAVWAFLVYLQDGRAWAPYAVMGAVVVGLQFQERAVLICLVLGFVAVALHPARGLRAVRGALRDDWPLWTGLVLILGCYLVAHRELAPGGGSEIGSVQEGARLFGNLIGRTIIPGLVGGPWRPAGQLGVIIEPSASAVVAGWLVVILVCAWSVRRGGPAVLWGWGLIAAFMVVDALMLAIGRTGTALTDLIGLSPRYGADVVPVAAIALALVVRAVRSRERPPAAGSRRRARWALGVTVVYLASSSVTMAYIADNTLNRTDREYVANLRSDLRADPDVTLVDTSPPQDIMTFLFESDARVSTLIGLAPEEPVFDQPSYDLRIAGQDGHLRPVDLLTPETAVPPAGRPCGFQVTALGTTIPLPASIEGDPLVVDLDYFTSVTGSVRIEAGDTTAVAPLRDAARLQVVVRGDVDGVRLTLEQELGDTSAEATGVVCATGVAVGYPVPEAEVTD
ncbi:hypothetical protein [Nocardioides sambongensis]|uniref:hypothetical protein n=1 Tax=Nocardioides sambongensis TaxID=2589074 RepID=UPI0015E84B3C|nr:hypothetical protein [Nocardioides sambongensis]